MGLLTFTFDLILTEGYKMQYIIKLDNEKKNYVEKKNFLYTVTLQQEFAKSILE